MTDVRWTKDLTWRQAIAAIQEAAAAGTINLDEKVTPFGEFAPGVQVLSLGGPKIVWHQKEDKAD